jgi:hypothetical protein
MLGFKCRHELISMVPWYILQVLFIASDLTNCFLTLVMQAHLQASSKSKGFQILGFGVGSGFEISFMCRPIFSIVSSLCFFFGRGGGTYMNIFYSSKFWVSCIFPKISTCSMRLWIMFHDLVLSC